MECAGARRGSSPPIPAACRARATWSRCCTRVTRDNCGTRPPSRHGSGTRISRFRPGPAIRALAEQSRGEFTTIYSAASFQAALDRLADSLAAEMMIEYIVPVGSKPNDVKVGVHIAGARVHGLGVAPR